MLPLDEDFDPLGLIEKNVNDERDKWPSLNKKMQIFSVLGKKLIKSLTIAKGYDYTAKVVDKKQSSEISPSKHIKLPFQFKDNSLLNNNSPSQKINT